MFCEKCGTEITNEDVFCPKCGTRVEDIVKENGESPVRETVIEQPLPAAGTAVVAKKHQVSVKALGIIGTVAVFLIAGIIALLIIENTVSAEKFIADDIKVTGYNGYATASVQGLYDYEGLARQVSGSAKTDNELLGGLADLGASIITSTYVRVELDKTDSLSNGDVVTATFTIDKDAINNLTKTRKKVRGKNVYVRKYKVNGLSEPIEIDVFEGIKSVSYDLTEDYNIIQIVYNTAFNRAAGDVVFSYNENSDSIKATTTDGAALGYIHFDYDADSIKSNGKVTLTADVDTERYITRGVVFTQLSKEYDAVTIDYIRNADDIKGNDLGLLKASAIKYFENYFSSNYNYLGAYFIEDFARKGFWNTNNRIYFVFENSESDGSSELIGVRFTDVKINSSGNIIDVKNEPDSYYRFYDVHSFQDAGKDLEEDGYNVTDISSKC